MIGRGPDGQQGAVVLDSGGQHMQFPNEIPQSLVKYDPPIFAGLEPSSEANGSGRGESLKAGVGIKRTCTYPATYEKHDTFITDLCSIPATVAFKGGAFRQRDAAGWWNSIGGE